ncbi:hypothetical protein F5Y09DRAFT_307410 [Xylaria sp. FL1042]|nr:hypothetical protein F5Y09DRAFT_307410 [Xylaria sp. FL1042]
MYSAIELRGLYLDAYMTERIMRQAYIWSFGCALLDCGVWVTMHERGRIEFRRESQRLEVSVETH